MAKTMWFGNEAHAQWVPVPKTGMQRADESLSIEFASDNGGLWIDDSTASHAVYNMEFPVSDRGYAGIEAFRRFKNGEWGNVSRLGRSGYLRFVDPMRTDDNLMPPAWAAPGIIEKSDWKDIFDVAATFSDVASNAYYQPLRKATYDLSSLANNAVPTKPNSVVTLLIPPTHKVWLGFTGTVADGGKVRVQPVNLDGSLATVVDLTGTADAAQPTLSASFSGATYKSVRIYLTRNAGTAPTATIASFRAQYDLIANTPANPSRHKPGYGHMGCKFRDSSRVETYIKTKGTGATKLIGASLVLAEVEPWAPPSS